MAAAKGAVSTAEGVDAVVVAAVGELGEFVEELGAVWSGDELDPALFCCGGDLVGAAFFGALGESIVRRQPGMTSRLRCCSKNWLWEPGSCSTQI